MEVTAPERFPVPGTPTAWTPGTNGLVSGEAVLVTATTEEDLAQYKGKLKGKWVLVVSAPDVAAFWDARAKRYRTDDLDAMELQPATPALEFGVTPPGQRGAAPRRRRASAPVPRAAAAPAGQRAGQAPAATPATPTQPQAGGGGNARVAFLRAEGALGTITTTAIGHGIYTIGGNRSADPAATLPAVSIAAEQYGRIVRTLAKNVPVTIEADIRSTYYPNPPVFNVVGDHGLR